MLDTVLQGKKEGKLEKRLETFKYENNSRITQDYESIISKV